MRSTQDSGCVGICSWFFSHQIAQLNKSLVLTLRSAPTFSLPTTSKMTSSFCSVLGSSSSYTGSTYSEEGPSLEERRRARDRESSSSGDASGEVAPAREVVVLDDSSVDGNAANRCSAFVRPWSSDVYACGCYARCYK
jgi:hypothetical protein